MTAVNRRGVVLVAVLALLWGSNFLWIKIALDGLPPVLLTFARLALGALVLVPIVWLRGERLPRDRVTVGHLIVAAFLGNALPYLLFAVGEQTVDSALAGVLNATTPLWTVLVALAARQERRVSVWKAVGLALGFLGTLLIFRPWSGTDGSLVGGLACLGASASYGLSYVYMARFLTPRALSPYALAAGQMVAATAILALAAPAAGSDALHLSTAVVWSMLALGPIGTGAAYVINYAIIGREGATAASAVTYLIPLVSVALGVTVLGEPITVAMGVGAGVVLAGVGLVRLKPGAAGQADPTTNPG